MIITTFDNIDIEAEIKVKHYYLGIDEDDGYSNDFSFDNILCIFKLELGEGAFERLNSKREK